MIRVMTSYVLPSCGFESRIVVNCAWPEPSGGDIKKNMAAPKEILDLVRRFDEHKESYISGQYNETQLRREFLDPFFKTLGWDIDNAQGLAEQYKDVIHEDSIKIGGNTKAPDYCFRIGCQTRRI
jgi:hypothetical protein